METRTVKNELDGHKDVEQLFSIDGVFVWAVIYCDLDIVRSSSVEDGDHLSLVKFVSRAANAANASPLARSGCSNGTWRTK